MFAFQDFSKSNSIGNISVLRDNENETRSVDETSIQTDTETNSHETQRLITNDIVLAEVSIAAEQKKRKLEDLYSTHDFGKLIVDEYELIKLKRVIRSNENPRIKILSRKGNSHIGMYADTTNTLKTSPVIKE